MMNKNITTIVLMLLTVFCCMASHSCANTTAAPSGGPKDSIPPVLLSVVPKANSVNVSPIEATVSLTFNEYTVVKTATDITVSPPTKRRPTSKIKGKSLVINFLDTLNDNTTYTIDFGNALADNNEGNIAPKYVYTFSTGPDIDSMYLTGTVVDCEKLTPVKGVLVALYEDLSDSACINNLPIAAAKTDDWGFFSIRNIKPRNYQIYAYTDDDNDYKYLPGEDYIAFHDTLFCPSKVVNDSIYELKGFDMKDTLGCEKRVSDINLSIFKEFFSKQFIKNKGLGDTKRGFIKFGAPDVVINSFQITGVDSTDIITWFTPTRDSMDFWINNNQVLPDSVLVAIEYLKTDSLGALVLTKENLSLAMTKEVRALLNKPEAKADTILKVQIDSKNELVEQEGIKLTFSHPITKANLDSIKFIATNPKNQNDTIDFTFVQDSIDLKVYYMQASQKYEVGYKYEVKIADNAFHDIYGRKSDATTLNIQLPNTDKTGSITLNVSGINNSRYIIELVNENKSQVFRKYIVTENCTLHFPYLNAGNYTFRVTEDRNSNGLFDTGNLFKRQQPEKVIIFKLPNGNEFIELPEQTDIEQDLTL